MEEKIRALKAQLKLKDEEIQQLKQKVNASVEENLPKVVEDASAPLDLLAPSSRDLSLQEIGRYSRQLILPEIGMRGQSSLKAGSVLIVGAGGLGCPAAMYLAAAGVGTIGLVDYDEADLSNLHRQVLHTEGRVGWKKSVSAAFACNQLNSDIRCVPYHVSLDSSNALAIIEKYDIVLDCTDNIATRYLLNDACVIGKKILVSGSALRFEGQLTVYNCKGGPCYRCLFPKPPPPETVTNCSDGGVLGVVPGIIGCLQALETVKIITGIGPSYSQKFLMFDGIAGSFRVIKLRPKQKDCAICGENPTITALIDYVQFCGAKATDKDQEIKILSKNDRISVTEFKEILDSGKNPPLIDVRQPVELEICHLPSNNLHNIPIGDIAKPHVISDLKAKIDKGQGECDGIYVVCRRGNDSQKAVEVLRSGLMETNIPVKDIKGGLHAWTRCIDPDFPLY